jgi:hypothetical protein
VVALYGVFSLFCDLFACDFQFGFFRGACEIFDLDGYGFFELRATDILGDRPDLGVRIDKARLDSIPVRSSRIFFGARHLLSVDF